MAAQEKFLLLAGVLKTEGGYASLHRGDDIPENADPDDVERLRSFGAIGTEEQLAVVEEPAADDFSDVLSGTVSEVVEAANGDPARAQQLLDAEQATDEPRKGVVEGLQKVIDGS